MEKKMGYNMKMFLLSVFLSFVAFLSLLELIKYNENYSIGLPKNININAFKETLIVKHKRKPLLIAVMTTEKYINNRIETLISVLGVSENDPRFDLMFFTEALPADSPFKNDKRFVVMSHVKNAYPPQQKSFEMLKYIGRKLSGKYRWVYRTDDDNYLMTEHLFSFVSSLDDLELGYVGRQGLGQAFEVKRLGLKGYNFCMGGVGIVFNWIMVKRLADFLDLALTQISSRHEDTELARAIRMHFNMFCTQNDYFDGLFYHNYYDSQGDLLRKYRYYLRDDKTFKARATRKDAGSKSREKFLYKFGPINFHALKEPFMFYYVSKSLYEMDLMTYFIKSSYFKVDKVRSRDIFVCDENKDNSVVSTFYARNTTVICNSGKNGKVFIFFRNYQAFRSKKNNYMYGLGYKSSLFVSEEGVYTNNLNNYRLILVVGVNKNFEMDRFVPVLASVEFSQIVLVNMLTATDALTFKKVTKDIRTKCDSIDLNSINKQKFLNCEHISFVEQSYTLEKGALDDDEIYIFVSNYYEVERRLHTKCLDLFSYHSREKTVVVIADQTQEGYVVEGVCSDYSVHTQKPRQTFMLNSIKQPLSLFLKNFPRNKLANNKKKAGKIEHFNLVLVQAG